MGCGSNRPVQQSRFLRIALIGPRQSGKTSLLACFLEQRFEGVYDPGKTPSVGVKTYYCGDTVTTLEVWEIKESAYLPADTSHAVVAVDCSQPVTLVQDQLTQLKTVHGFSTFTVAVTKTDLLPEGETQAFLSNLRKTLVLSDDIPTYMTSALQQTGVRELFVSSLRPSQLTLSGTAGSDHL